MSSSWFQVYRKKRGEFSHPGMPYTPTNYMSVISPKKDDPTVMEKLKQCCLCGYRSKWSANMKRHVATHTEPTFQCPECPSMYCTPSGLKVHMGLKHDIHDFSCICPTCKATFSATADLDKHLEDVHKLSREEYEYQCGRCDRIFGLPSQLHGHWATHITSENPLPHMNLLG